MSTAILGAGGGGSPPVAHAAVADGRAAGIRGRVRPLGRALGRAFAAGTPPAPAP
jgi:hypothetical protein